MAIENDKTTPHRFDVVGSFLRPENLKQARIQFEKGQIDAQELKQVEDKAITELIQKEKQAGLKVITDGEFRRATWHLDFMWAYEGIGHAPTNTGLPFHDETAKIDDTFLVGKVELTKEHPFIEHFRFVQQFEDETTVAKLTIPAPAQFIEQFIMPMNREQTDKYYTNDQELLEDIVAGYGAFIKRHIQQAVVIFSLMTAHGACWLTHVQSSSLVLTRKVLRRSRHYSWRLITAFLMLLQLT